MSLAAGGIAAGSPQSILIGNIMKTQIKNLNDSKVKITVTVEPEEMLHHYEHAIEHIAPSVKISGFRPGKAPRAMIESSVGISRILSEAIDLAVNEAYFKALSEYQLSPIASPKVAINKYPSYGHTEAEIGNDLELELEVDTFPKMEMPELKNVKVELPKKEEIKEEDLNKILDNLRKQKANFKEIDRAAKEGDFAEISFEGSLKKVKIDAMSSKHHPLVIGEGSLIPGFEDQIIGMKKGESKEFKIKFPTDYHGKEYAGKEAEFKVGLNELKEVVLPEIDEEFAKSFGQKNVEELNKAIRESLEVELAGKHKTDVETKIIEKVLPLVKVEVPEVLVEQEVLRLMKEVEGNAQKMGLSLEAYLGNIKKTEEGIKKEMREAAKKNVKIGLLLGSVIENQKIDKNDPEAGRKALEYLIKTVSK